MYNDCVMENKEKQQFSETQVFERLTNPEVEKKKEKCRRKEKEICEKRRT